MTYIAGRLRRKTCENTLPGMEKEDIMREETAAQNRTEGIAISERRIGFEHQDERAQG